MRAACACARGCACVLCVCVVWGWVGFGVCVCVTGISKAFDYISHELRLANLKVYGFADNALVFYSDRKQRTKINASDSKRLHARRS